MEQSSTSLQDTPGVKAHKIKSDQKMMQADEAEHAANETIVIYLTTHEKHFGNN